MTPANIKQARKTLGLTQNQMAHVMQVRQATVSDWETGKRRIGDQSARLLQAYLKGYRPDDWPT